MEQKLKGQITEMKNIVHNGVALIVEPGKYRWLCDGCYFAGNQQYCKDIICVINKKPYIFVEKKEG